MDIYFSNFRLISICYRGLTNAFDMSLKHFEELEVNILKDYFCFKYPEMDFGTRKKEGLKLKCGTLKFLLTIFLLGEHEMFL